jgi:Spx/MgsR family transcriptional regulator
MNIGTCYKLRQEAKSYKIKVKTSYFTRTNNQKIMIQVYGIKNCNKIRDTLKWLESQEAEYHFYDLKKEPLTREELEEFVHRIGLDVLVNRKGMKYRQLGLNEKNLDDKELFEQLLKHQTMIKRPVIIKDEAILVGYDEEAFETFIT